MQFVISFPFHRLKILQHYHVNPYYSRSCWWMKKQPKSWFSKISIPHTDHSRDFLYTINYSIFLHLQCRGVFYGSTVSAVHSSCRRWWVWYHVWEGMDWDWEIKMATLAFTLPNFSLRTRALVTTVTNLSLERSSKIGAPKSSGGRKVPFNMEEVWC